MLISERLTQLRLVAAALKLQTEPLIGYMPGVHLTGEHWLALKEALQRDIAYNETLIEAHGTSVTVVGNQLGSMLCAEQNTLMLYRKGLSHD